MRRKARRPAEIVPSEDAEQLMLAQWLDAIGVLWCHVPNSAKRSMRLAEWYRARGLKAGVPDVLIFDPPPSDPSRVGVAIELKRSAGQTRVTPAQLQWLGALDRCRWVAIVCAGAKTAAEELMRLGYGRRKGQDGPSEQVDS